MMDWANAHPYLTAFLVLVVASAVFGGSNR